MTEPDDPKTLQEFWRHHTCRPGARTWNNVIPRILCNDGFSFSLQASENHYCTPRRALMTAAYTAWEVAFLSAPEPLFEPYAESSDEYYECVYPYTPTSVVEAVVEKHGGIASEAAREAHEFVELQEVGG